MGVLLAHKVLIATARAQTQYNTDTAFPRNRCSATAAHVLPKKRRKHLVWLIRTRTGHLVVSCSHSLVPFSYSVRRRTRPPTMNAVQAPPDAVAVMTLLKAGDGESGTVSSVHSYLCIIMLFCVPVVFLFTMDQNAKQHNNTAARRCSCTPLRAHRAPCVGVCVWRGVACTRFLRPAPTHPVLSFFVASCSCCMRGPPSVQTGGKSLI